MISQARQVESLFVYWPEFADAKIVEFSWAQAGSLCLALHYIDAEHSKEATVWLLFSGVSEVELTELRSENVLDVLTITAGEPIAVGLEPCYGLGGTFLCSTVEVTHVAHVSSSMPMPLAAQLSSGVIPQRRVPVNNVSTRIASIADLNVVSTLFDCYRQFYEQAPDLALARQFIGERMQNNESVIILAIGENQQATGFCQLYPSFCSVEAKPIYTLYDLFVVPEARKYGTGTLLLRAAERHARKNGKARMDLMTAKTNEAAQAVYVSLGWVRDEDFHAYSKRIEA